jgi:hypothetical protein
MRKRVRRRSAQIRRCLSLAVSQQHAGLVELQPWAARKDKLALVGPHFISSYTRCNVASLTGRSNRAL